MWQVNSLPSDFQITTQNFKKEEQNSKKDKYIIKIRQFKLLYNKACSFHMTVNSSGSTTVIFHKCHILLKFDTLDKVIDNKKKQPLSRKSNAHYHFLNLPLSTAVPREIMRLICSKFTFQVPPLMIQHDILPVEHLIADLTCKLLIPVLFLVF